MSQAMQRFIRVGSHGRKIESDDIQDPVVLAHRLMDIQVADEKQWYGHKLRLSGIGDVCVRERLIGFRNNLRIPQNNGCSMQVTFDIGNAIHEFLQNSPNYFGKNRVGWWRCQSCGTKIFGRKPENPCSKCHSKPECFRYWEHTLKLPEDMPVAGHPDFFIEVEEGLFRIVDFKTINGEDFGRLTEPKFEHVSQLNGYMYYSQFDQKLPIRTDAEAGYLLYVSKKHEVKSLPFKMFLVRKSNLVLSDIQTKVELFKRGLSDKEFLPEPLVSCSSVEFLTGRAKYCPVRDICKAAFLESRK